MFFKRHVERYKLNICNLDKTEIILGMLWLVAYNLEIDWKLKRQRRKEKMGKY